MKKKILKKQLFKLLKEAKKHDTKAAKILSDIQAYKTRKQIEKEKAVLKTGMVINNGNVYER